MRKRTCQTEQKEDADNVCRRCHYVAHATSNRGVHPGGEDNRNVFGTNEVPAVTHRYEYLCLDYLSYLLTHTPQAVEGLEE